MIWLRLGCRQAKLQPVRLWEVATRQPLATFTGHHDFISGLAFSPDGGLLASSSKDKTIRLWGLGPLYDRRPWPERIAELEQQYQLHLEDFDLKPLSPADNPGR
jgi:WD40 repeat protein